jgi:hypothetical protein
LRNVLIGLALVLTTFIVVTGNTNAILIAAGILLMLGIAVLGRAMFYVMVVPTTMPGAFFWKNKGFVEHARESGLADMPQVGVMHEGHHEFKLAELLSTIRDTSTRDKLTQLKAIFSFR